MLTSGAEKFVNSVAALLKHFHSTFCRDSLRGWGFLVPSMELPWGVVVHTGDVGSLPGALVESSDQFSCKQERKLWVSLLGKVVNRWRSSHVRG